MLIDDVKEVLGRTSRKGRKKSASTSTRYAYNCGWQMFQRYWMARGPGLSCRTGSFVRIDHPREIESRMIRD